MSYGDPITPKQLDYIYRLVDLGLLFEDDFPAGTYRKKRLLCRSDGNSLIRRAKWRLEIERGQDWQEFPLFGG